MRVVTSQAHANIALVKYWGKREGAYNLPATPSLSITLDALVSTTTLTTDDSITSDSFMLNGRATNNSKMTACLERMRKLCETPFPYLKIESTNNFPTAAGLASSASGFAALVTAIDELAQCGLSAQQKSVQARICSGSAARSIFGGFVSLDPNTIPLDSSEQNHSLACQAAQIANETDWPLEIVIAICSEKEKDVSSTLGMQSTKETSPYYSSWIKTTNQDFEKGVAVVKSRDFEQLAEISEASCLKMHGLMLSANPGLVYWNAATLDCIHALRRLRKTGVPVFFTIDAGPQVKAVCLPEACTQVNEVLSNIQGVHRTLKSALGPGARIIANPAQS